MHTQSALPARRALADARLGREWDVELAVGRGRIRVTARNERPGSEYVGSKQMQAGIHRADGARTSRRWTTCGPTCRTTCGT
jgi:hypothetical protein